MEIRILGKILYIGIEDEQVAAERTRSVLKRFIPKDDVLELMNVATMTFRNHGHNDNVGILNDYLEVK